MIRHGGGGGGQAFTFTGYPGICSGQYFAKGRQNVNVQYSAGYAVTPYDVELACKQILALTYKKHGWIGQKSRAMGMGAGSESYVDFDVPPMAEAVIVAYTRVSMY